MAPPTTPVLQRLQARSIIIDECWVWQGKIDRKGYGQIYVGSRSDGTRRTARVHRVAYEAVYGPLESDQQVDHVWARGCRHKGCWNPAHLEAVSSGENTRRHTGRQTHCKHGHEFTLENTWLYRGRRVCRACARRKRSEWGKRRRAERSLAPL